MNDHGPRGPAFWVCLAVGWAAIGYAISGMLDNAAATRPPRLAGWVLGGALLHDVLLAPLVIAIGWLIVRVVPARVRRAVIVGLVLSGAILLIAWIPLRGYGVRPDNPTLQPIDYATSVPTALAIAWVIAFVVGLVDWRRQPSSAP